MKKITLRLDDEIDCQARIRAAEKDLSVSALVTRLLTEDINAVAVQPLARNSGTGRRVESRDSRQGAYAGGGSAA
jgi:plasmid stability protein